MQKNCGFRFVFGFTKLTAVSFFCSVFLYCVLFNVYDSELELQRYGMKKNTVTVDPIMLQDEMWMRECEKPFPNCRSRFLKTEPWKPSFRFLNFEVGSVRFLETDIQNFYRIPHTPT